MFPSNGVKLTDVMWLVNAIRSGQWQHNKLETVERALWILGCAVAQARAASGEVRPAFGMTSASAMDLAMDLEHREEFTTQQAADLATAVIMETRF